jgi:DNA replicative helicase MCM subunit Mcm2 (Cdc46/Mcm family)
MPRKYDYSMALREPFICENCRRLVTVEEQVKDNYHQTRFCRTHYQEWKREQNRLAVQKHRESKRLI